MTREVKADKSDLTMVWLDLAIAYGGIPHKLIVVALHHYHTPEHVISILKKHSNGMQLRFTTNNFTTTWQDLEKGIVTGCTVTPILFVMGMNIIMKVADRKTRGPKMNSGIYQPSNRGFINDLTITTTTHVQARWTLSALDEVVNWARMKFKLKKSRCMIIKKGRLTKQFIIRVQGEEIPSITDNPVKCLGRWYDNTPFDKKNVRKVEEQVTEWLKRIDKSGLQGKYKAWLYQHGVLPRLSWNLMLYELPLTAVETLERCTIRKLRSWLGVPPSFTAVGLYSKTSQLQLPLSSIVEEFKVAKCRLVMTLKDFTDIKVQKAGMVTKTGRKWSAGATVSKAESTLELQDIVGNIYVGRRGLGVDHFQQWSKAEGKEKRDRIVSVVRTEEEQQRKSRAVELGQQGSLTRWNLPERKIT
ncbi:uncharacterized protein LOC132563801 [Ylistrum balloti]|uniref:uncharacterized protein LOC132563801 n=1 Tax=Ylistrum balloti TaxID=509963 RepID=UPI002905988A|nr:uncharacterized protein LOC132563801 [Ylistrum balloti]